MKENKKGRKISVGEWRNSPFSKDMSKERGITLISLIIMIVVLVILSAVVIRGIEGGGLIGTTETAAEEYNITSYKEQIEQKVRGTIQSYSARGGEIGVVKIAEELNNETLWVKSALANIDTSINNEDIIVITTDKYIFEIYYDGNYGAIFVEYIGKDNGKEIPNIKARYEKRAASIFAEARGAEKLEVIYRGEVVGTPIEKPNGEQKIEVDGIGTGWYKIKVASSNGKLRYAWVRANTISEKLTVPEIKVIPENPDKGLGNNNWYIGAVKVSITTDNQYAKEIHYREMQNGIVTKEDEIYNGEFRVELQGTTKIVAWIEDEEGYASEETEAKEIKIDSIKPEVIHEEKSAKEKVGDWYKADVEITIKGEDSNSGIEGYKYMTVGQDASWSEKKPLGEEGDKIVVQKEGTTEIKIKVIDNAGNESEETMVTIKKDTVAPTFETNVEVTNQALDGFTVSALASDEVSGNTAYGGKITYTCYITKNGQEEKVGENNTGIFVITGLARGTTYDIKVVAQDPAGNISEKVGRGTTKLNTAPTWTISPKEKSKTNISIKLTMTAKDDDGDNLTYTIKYGTYNEAGGKNAYIGTKEIKNVQEGVVQEPEITGLSDNTTYYFEVTVTDGKEKTLGEVNIKTNEIIITKEDIGKKLKGITLQ